MAVIDPRIPLAAVPQQNAFQAFTQGEQARHQAQMGKLQQQGAQNELAAQAGTMLARGVLGSKNPAEAYPMAIQQAQRMGMDVAQLPQQWGPEAEIMTRMFAADPAERTALQQNLEMLPPEQRLQAARVHFGLEPKAEGPEMRTVGNTLLEVGPDGAREVYRGQEETKPRTSIAKLQADYDAGLIDKETYDMARQKALASSQGITIGPDGTVQIGGSKPLKEYEAKAQSLGSRMESAYGRVDETEQEILEEGGPSLLDASADNLGKWGNFVKSSEYQAYQTAAREWIGGLLRLDSGAAVPDSEFERYFNTYFIAPGDTEKTAALKKQAREAAMSAVSSIMPRQDAAQPAQAGAPSLQGLSDEELMRMLQSQ